MLTLCLHELRCGFRGTSMNLRGACFHGIPRYLQEASTMLPGDFHRLPWGFHGLSLCFHRIPLLPCRSLETFAVLPPSWGAFIKYNYVAFFPRCSMELSWIHMVLHGSSVNFYLAFHGASMVFHRASIVLSLWCVRAIWCVHDIAWCFHGLAWRSHELPKRLCVRCARMGLSLTFHGAFKDSHGTSMDSHGTSMDSHGTSMDSHGGFMMLPWSLRGLPWCFHGFPDGAFIYRLPRVFTVVFRNALSRCLHGLTPMALPWALRCIHGAL